MSLNDLLCDLAYGVGIQLRSSEDPKTYNQSAVINTQEITGFVQCYVTLNFSTLISSLRSIS